MSTVLISLSVAILMVLGHLFAGNLRLLPRISRNICLSAAGGVSVAYVFIHLLPELQVAQVIVSESPNAFLDFIEHHIYLIALMGLSIFYGLEWMVRQSARQQSQGQNRVQSETKIYWLHIGSFAANNVLIGYLLVHRGESDMRSLVLFVIAMGLHFLVNDNALNDHHEDDYARRGRWILAAAILIGWMLGYLIKLPELYIYMLLAFLAGGIILNVLKEELPDEGQSDFRAFIIGVVAYTALLLAL
jgi:hypothetical protein